MNEVLSSLKVMQRMERLATNVYKYQISAFKGDIADKLNKACENEREHAQTLAKLITVMNGHPPWIGMFFGFAGGVAGIATRIIGKTSLFKMDIYIERKAVEDYTKFMRKIKYPEDTAALLTRIIDDEKRHVENWTAAVTTLESKKRD